MQIIIEHWKEVKLKSHKKKDNAPIIEECTGVQNYNGHDDQRKLIIDKITRENYSDMKQRISRLSEIDTEKNSSNIGRFLRCFEANDDDWIKLINNKLE